MSHLVAKANDYIFHAVAVSTRNSYTSALNSYSAAFLSYKQVPPFPATQDSLCVWLVHSANRPHRPLKPTTLRTYLSYLSSLHAEYGFRDFLDDKHLVFRCWKGIRREKGEKKMIRRPITTHLISQMKTKLTNSFASRMFYAAASLATYGLLRMGEFTQSEVATNSNPFKLLTIGQIELFDAKNASVTVMSTSMYPHVTHMSLTLLLSKTDPFRESVTIHIGHAIPIKAMLNYLTLHPALSNSSAPLFVLNPATSPLKPLTRESMITCTRRILGMLGHNEAEYHGHSYRKGGATSLHEAGVADSMIQVIGRWRSDCYKLYIVTALKSILNASRQMR
jgi:hypothetical protein